MGLVTNTLVATLATTLSLLTCAPIISAQYAPGYTAAPVVPLDYGSYVGMTNLNLSVDYYLGMAYAQPPTGNLRFKRPEPPLSFNGTQNVTTYGNSCPQQNSTQGLDATLSNIPGINMTAMAPIVKEFTAGSGVHVWQAEDCLNLNVLRPTNTTPQSRLPVVVWMYGGGFVQGDASSTDATPLVQRSVALGEPVIFVSFNYRLNAFGFLGGREAEAAGSVNVGLYDQRMALRWVQKYIPLFGGDPTRVTVWGQSAGSMSILAQMLAFGGKDEGLFRAGFMMSGYTQALLTADQAQQSYDQLVNFTNCSTPTALATYNGSSLECLRNVSFTTLGQAVGNLSGVLSYAGLNLTFGPRVEGPGGFLQDTFRQGVAKGKYVRVPLVAGECADEGTLFSINTTNITTEANFKQYLTTAYGNANETVQTLLSNAYTPNITQGSPYLTNVTNAVTPQYKRVAAFNGDFYFQAPRRSMFAKMSKTQKIWSYLFRRGEKENPVLGAFHKSDLFAEFFLPNGLNYTTDYVGMDSLINFAYQLDPNYNPYLSPPGAVSSVLQNYTWPHYTTKNPMMFTFDDPTNYSLTTDDYRKDEIALQNKLQKEFGF